MKKNSIPFTYIFAIVFLLNSNLFASTFNTVKEEVDIPLLINIVESTAFSNSDIAVAPPVVSSPIYYCQGSAAVPLTATASPGNTLRWYTAATGGTFTLTAPTPSTTAVGNTFFYVSETDGVLESTRVKIDVNIVADNGSKIILLRCDPTQIAAADRNSSVLFDWSNTPGLPNQYNYSYTIDGGSPVVGSTAPSSLQVFGLLPGQSVTLTVAHATYPCDRSVITCSVPCGTFTPAPNFSPIAPICSGSPAPILGPTSPNGISGTWSPAVVSNTASGSYVFTPNVSLHPCATTQTLNVTVLPLVSPSFTGIPTSVCQNAVAPVLPNNSNNSPSITGSWSPSTVNTALLGPVTYTFTPNVGQCTTATPTRVTITVVANNSPNFSQIPPFCSGNTPPLLATTSPTGVTGSWSPSVISNTVSRSYVFTPNPNQCSTSQTLNVTVTKRVSPGFSTILAFCEGATPPVLATTSPNGITGTWNPAQIDNKTSGTYVFTPNANECATTQSLTTTVNAKKSPGFSSFSICSGSVPPTLKTTSPSGVNGSWSPAVVDNMTSGAYVFSPDANQCATDQTINVVVNPSNTLTDFDWTVTEAFSNNQVVTISPTAAKGDYSYKLDDGPFQTSPVFEFVSAGYHTVTVIENNGCSNPIVKSNILVIDYPRFFTPNGDGYNESWNILSLRDDASAKIRIFDRYGKLLKELTPNSGGWNGLYIGRPMPSDDYWFVVEYTEQSILKKYRSHFSLKR